MSIKDSINQAKAEAKEVVGKVTGDKKTEAEGTAEKFADKVKGAVEDVKDSVEGAIEGVKNAVHKDDKDEK